MKVKKCILIFLSKLRPKASKVATSQVTRKINGSRITCRGQGYQHPLDKYIEVCSRLLTGLMTNNIEIIRRKKELL